jgi:hypothetical protein
MKKWFSKLWKYLFASPPKQELVTVQPPPICGHCGSMDVEVIGTLPVRHFLCRACGKSSSPEPEDSSGTEVAMVRAKNVENILRLPPRNDGLGLVEFLKRQATRRTEEER